MPLALVIQIFTSLHQTLQRIPKQLQNSFINILIKKTCAERSRSILSPHTIEGELTNLLKKAEQLEKINETKLLLI